VVALRRPAIARAGRPRRRGSPGLGEHRGPNVSRHGYFECVPLYALVDGVPQRVVAGGPRRALCAECHGVMRGRAGPIRIWHWAHVVYNPHCEAARESEWHLGWKVLGAVGSQEVKVGRRRADVLAPGGFAVEFQASALDVVEVRARENDWGAQGGIVWVHRADRELAAGRIVLSDSFPGCDESLLRPEDRATLDVTWSHAPERVRASRAPSFLDFGDGELLFVGGWRHGSSPLSGYGWRVSRDWVVKHVLQGNVLPCPLATDPVTIKRQVRGYMVRADEAERLERLPRQAAEPENRSRGDERRVPPVSDEELQARRARRPTSESPRQLSPPSPGSVITPRLREWRLAREAKRAKERDDSANQPGSACALPDSL
jgi:Competence protein CoiA-like family